MPADKEIPTAPDGSNYDEGKVPGYELPDPLCLQNGEVVSDAAAWTNIRRNELLTLFADHVYGRTPIGRPKEMTWDVVSEDRSAMDGSAVFKTTRLHLTGEARGPQCTRMDLHMTLPNTGRPVPVFLMTGYATFGRMPEFNRAVFERGYGMVYADVTAVQQDMKDEDGGYASGIRAFYAPGQDGPGEQDWGALAAWAWALSRGMDYLETDADIDPKRVFLNGFSRFGKAAMWAGAQDTRFAATFSGESGCCGHVIVRRQFGETVGRITTGFPYWFSRKFASYADRVNDLPVDWHELVALYAPRPVYIATAEDDLWGDPRGSFLAGVHAGPAYRLFEAEGLGVSEQPDTDNPVGDRIGFHKRAGGHGQNAYDWEQYLNFADRLFA